MDAPATASFTLLAAAIAALIAALALAAAGGLVPGLSPAPAEAAERSSAWSKTPYGSRVLKQGMRGRDVKGLQIRLNRLGIPTGRDGIYGNSTRLDVLWLERHRGWGRNGRVDRRQAGWISDLVAQGYRAPKPPARPRPAAQKRPAPAVRKSGRGKRRWGPWKNVKFGTRMMRVRMRGRDVKVLQKFLNRLGIPTTRDGVYGKQTYRNVKRLERTRGWHKDGRVQRKQARKIRRLVGKGYRVAAGTGTTFYHFAKTAPAVVVSAPKAGTVSVAVVDDRGSAVKTIAVQFDSAGEKTVPWYGRIEDGSVAVDGAYGFAVGNGGTTSGKITGGQTEPFDFRRFIFPVRGAHSYGGSGSRFGAPRGDHRHQGQDVAASCGVPMVAAQGGKVITRSYQAGGAGYYIVIRSQATGHDLVYMHMQGPGPWSSGDWVRTGQKIGKVGTTGSSTGCHLHFERWTKPGWYAGGHPFDPLPGLKWWDSYS